MGALSFPVFPECPARTEYGCDMAGNLSRQNGLKKGAGSSAPMTGQRWRLRPRRAVSSGQPLDCRGNQNLTQEPNTGMKRSEVLTFQTDQRQGYSHPLQSFLSGSKMHADASAGPKSGSLRKIRRRPLARLST